MLVRTYMSSPVLVVQASEPAKNALELMRHRKVRRLPVVENGKLVGIVTRGDLEKGLGEDPTAWRRLHLKVADAMTKDPVVAPPGETLDGAARLMLQRKISGLPVVEDGKVVGLITESDLFRALCQLLGFGEPGARVTFMEPDTRDLLDVVQRHAQGLEVTSLAARHNPLTHEWEVVMRARGAGVALKS